MDADKVIEWITHVMGIEPTTHQQDMARQMLKGNAPTAAIMDEGIRIPDHAFIPDAGEK